MLLQRMIKRQLEAVCLSVCVHGWMHFAPIEISSTPAGTMWEHCEAGQGTPDVVRAWCLRVCTLQPDEAAALLHLQMAAMSGDNAAQMALGHAHLYGIDVPKSCHTAASFYAPVAEHVSKRGAWRSSSSIGLY